MKYSPVVFIALCGIYACSSGGPDSSSTQSSGRTPPPNYVDHSESIKQTLEDVAAKHPGGKYVTFDEWKQMSTVGAKRDPADFPGRTPQDFYDGVGTTGIWTNGPGSCQCDNLAACNNMFVSYCYDDGSGYCYTWQDPAGQTWGYCGCNCIL
jgi:hypothetical protein